MLAGAPIENDDELAKHSLEDVNGDGLADVVVVVGRTLKYAISRNGQGFFQVRTLTSDDLEGGGQIPDRQDRNVLFADMNANGSQDVVWLGRGGDVQYLELFPVRPNLLTRITNGLGSVIDVSYGTSVQHLARAAEPWSTPLPHPMIVVDRIDTWDELSEEHEIDTFTYRNGFYDGLEKQFRGYAEVVQTLVGDEDHEEGTQAVVFDVGQDDPYRHGLQLSTVQTSAGRVLIRSETEYEDCPVAEVPANGLRFPVRHLCAVGTTTTLEEGRPGAEHVRLATRQTHDGYGNVLVAANEGVVAVGGGACPACPAGRGPEDFGAPCGPQCLGDEQFTETEYVRPANTGGRWILHAPTRTRIYGREGSALVSEVLNYYDGPDFVGLPLGQLTHGKLSRSTVAKATGEPPIAASRSAFDVHGNPIATLDPLGTLDGDTHRREYTYDAEGLRILETDILLEDAESNPYRLRRETQYEPLFDKVSESTAWMRVEDDQVLSPRRSTSFVYDQFGRLMKRVLPGGDSVQNPTEEFVYELESPVNRVLVRKRSQVGGAYDLETASCMDGRGRSLQTRTRIEQGRWQVDGYTVYDRRSAPSSRFQPYVEPDGQCDTAPPEGVLAQRFAYDATDRRLTVTEPDADLYGASSVSRTEYLPLVTRIWDENDADPQSPHANTPTTHGTDGLGRLTTLERLLAPQGPPAVVTAQYDGLGRMTGYTDPAGHQKRQAFDLAGRLLSIDDPNAGRTEMTYDDAGNVLTRTDARGETVAIAYDGANRPIAKWEDEATDDPEAPFLTSAANPEYPVGGRRLRPEELNPLTRARAAGADVNANDISDVEEAQETFAVGYNPALRPFVDFAHFIELYTSSYLQNVASGVPCASDDECGSDYCLGGRCGARRGVLTIRERSRCDADFPLGYRGPEAGDADVADGDTTDGYWRSCVRNRDARWDVDPGGDGELAGLQHRGGFDFAQFSCGADRRTGTCAVPPPIARPPEGPFEAPPAHGVCDTPPDARAPDLPWMGMSHHSQFKCVRAIDPIAAQDERVRPYEHPFNAFFALNDVPETPNDDRRNPLTLHQCGLTPAVPGAPPAVQCDAIDGQAVRRRDVGFASVRHVDTSGTGLYTRGCIDEWKPAPVASPRNVPADVDAWRDLCPGHRENPIGALGAGNPSAFGRLACGCTAHTGGAYCEIPCAEALFSGDNADVVGCDPATGYCPFGTADQDHRVGLWVCGGVATTSVADDDPEAPPYLETTTPGGTTWRLRQGGFPAMIRAEAMQENPGDPNTGWRLR